MITNMKAIFRLLLAFVFVITASSSLDPKPKLTDHHLKCNATSGCRIGGHGGHSRPPLLESNKTKISKTKNDKKHQVETQADPYNNNTLPHKSDGKKVKSPVGPSLGNRVIFINNKASTSPTAATDLINLPCPNGESGETCFEKRIYINEHKPVPTTKPKVLPKTPAPSNKLKPNKPTISINKRNGHNITPSPSQLHQLKAQAQASEKAPTPRATRHAVSTNFHKMPSPSPQPAVLKKSQEVPPASPAPPTIPGFPITIPQIPFVSNGNRGGSNNCRSIPGIGTICGTGNNISFGGVGSGGGIVPMSTKCEIKGTKCYNKTLTCPKKCYYSFSRSGKGFGAGGGGGGCNIDCHKCTTTCSSQ